MTRKFVPKPGQVDFTHARWAPVINCVLQYQDKILLVKRSSNLQFYPGAWNGISGFLDDGRSLRGKVTDEIQEETGLTEAQIRRIELGTIFDFDDPQYNKTWIVHPVFVEVTTNKITLDWEADRYAWVPLDGLANYQILPDFARVLEALSPFVVRTK